MKAYHNASINWNRVVLAYTDRERQIQKLGRRAGYLGDLIYDMCYLKLQGKDAFSTSYTRHLQKDNGGCSLYLTRKNTLQMDLRWKGNL